MKIFLTGATGFIGKFVLDILVRNHHEVLALVRKEPDLLALESSSVNYLQGDLVDFERLKPQIKSFNPHVVIHLAWERIPDFSADICQSNLSQSIALIDFLTEQTQCQKIVFAGSCFEYGLMQGACRESMHREPSSFFTWAKLSLLNYTALRCQQKNIKWVWMRIFYVYGPGQRKQSLIPTLIDSFLSHEMPTINNPFNANDFIYVQDVAQGFYQATVADIPSGIYNLGTGDATCVIDICELVEKQIHSSAQLSQRVRNSSLAKQTVNFWADMKKTQEALNWTPKISLEEGIANCIKALEHV